MRRKKKETEREREIERQMFATMDRHKWGRFVASEKVQVI